jgi:hypothetical protein
VSTLDELVARTFVSRYRLADVLQDEIEAGRVRVDGDGGYELVPDRFDPDVLAALAELEPSDDDRSHHVPMLRISAPSSGELARSFA